MRKQHAQATSLIVPFDSVAFHKRLREGLLCLLCVILWRLLIAGGASHIYSCVFPIAIWGQAFGCPNRLLPPSLCIHWLEQNGLLWEEMPLPAALPYMHDAVHVSSEPWWSLRLLSAL